MCCVCSALSAKWSFQSVPLIVLATPDFNQSDKQCRWCISQSKKEWGGSNPKIPARQPPGRTGDSAFRNVESNLSMTRFKRIRTLANAAWLLVKLQTSDSKGQTCWCQWVKCWPAGPLCPTSRGSTASWIKKKKCFLKNITRRHTNHSIAFKMSPQCCCESSVHSSVKPVTPSRLNTEEEEQVGPSDRWPLYPFLLL